MFTSGVTLWKPGPRGFCRRDSSAVFECYFPTFDISSKTWAVKPLKLNQCGAPGTKVEHKEHVHHAATDSHRAELCSRGYSES